MGVTILSCPDCGDEWHYPGLSAPRETCRDCGAELETEIVEVGDG